MRLKRRVRALAALHRTPATIVLPASRDTTGILAMNLKKALKHALEEKQVRLFEQKKRGDRKTDRHYVQVVSTIDDLTRKQTHDTTRRKQRRKAN